MDRTQLARSTIAVAIAAGLGATGTLGDTGTAVGALDGNQDGSVARDEAEDRAALARVFSRADDHGDGRLNARELAVARSLGAHRASLRELQLMEDRLVSARVLAALRSDVVIRRLGLTVAARRGTILLSGYVHRESQARRAEAIAAAVPGVLRVRSALAIGT